MYIWYPSNEWTCLSIGTCYLLCEFAKSFLGLHGAFDKLHQGSVFLHWSILVDYFSLLSWIIQTTLLVPGNYQGDRKIVQNQIFDHPGKYRIKMPTVAVRTTGTVLVEMTDKNGIHFSDEFSLTFHMHYYKLLKWLLVLPMIGMFGILVILRPQEGTPLPSFSRNTELWVPVVHYCR